ncbi:Pentatricopeptide repeat-containing protein -mitochondrial [Striga hermonthica]|uniref:Pentatricopeptide repeat-containing protein -mitochondrial n=1 Tax=Striga hermonthica TaxID=68872 RepID=A0A9N7RQK7_STRHE|nr:Pentatricopeptide repeat-containing protein -mitochondrial [Striga hermonthica]
MWALRRASSRLGNQGLSSGTGRIFCAKPDIARRSFSESYHAGVIEPQEKTFDGFLTSSKFFRTSSGFKKSTREIRSFSSGADAKSAQEDNDDLDDDLAKSDLSEEDDGTTDELQTEFEALGDDVAEKNSPGTKASSEMAKAILRSLNVPVSKVLNEWLEEGNELSPTEATLAMLQLRRRKMFGKALELSEWLESKECFEPSNASYASRVDLIAKVRGLYKAEDYINQIPESFKGELVYRTLLANSVSFNNLRKAEATFNKMKTLGFPMSCFSCNQLLLIYKHTDRKKLSDLLLLMEKEKIKPSTFTYQILIDIKGQSHDIPAMEQILAQMKSDGLQPTTQIQVNMARHYAAQGLKDKAEAILKEIEGEEGLEKNRWACRWLMPIYALLGREDQVERIWKVCENDNPWVLECLTAVEAWGQLSRVDKSEEAFEKLCKKVNNPNSKQYAALLRVYAKNKMLDKGKELVRRMGESGRELGSTSWDALVRLYVGAGEVEKADSVLAKAVEQRKGRPLFVTYLAIMEGYAGRGDVHNAEKVLMMMRRAGYSSKLKPYQILLEAYVKGGKTAYGMNERLKAEGIFVNGKMARQLAKIDPFRKTNVSELIE